VLGASGCDRGSGNGLAPSMARTGLMNLDSVCDKKAARKRTLTRGDGRCV
jgi:hypothetical protein